MTDTRLRLTLLGGYLGSGKTTWLRHQLHVGAFGPRVHVVVNEAAEVPVDDALLSGAAGMTLLAGGCCCCVGRNLIWFCQKPSTRCAAGDRGGWGFSG